MNTPRPNLPVEKKNAHTPPHNQVIKCQLTEHVQEHAQWSDTLYMTVHKYNGFELFM